MARLLFFAFIVLLTVDFSAFGRVQSGTSQTEEPSTEEDDRQDVSKGRKAINPEKIPQRIESLKDEKKFICQRLTDYRKSVKGRNKKELVLSSTGYYRPSIVHGLESLRSMTDNFSETISSEIDRILACDLEKKVASGYIDKLQRFDEQVRAKYNRMPEMRHSRIR